MTQGIKVLKHYKRDTAQIVQLVPITTKKKELVLATFKVLSDAWHP